MINQARQETPFQTAAPKNIQQSIFDLSYDHKTTFKLAQLIPFARWETLPNDKFFISHQIFLRFQPLFLPLIHRINLTVDYFYVPNRIMWPHFNAASSKGWTEFITEAEPTVPWAHLKLGKTQWNAIAVGHTTGSTAPEQEKTILDYLGFRQPPDMTAVSGISDQEINALPFFAYHKIWNDFYRRPQLQDELDIQLTDGDNWAKFSTDVDLFYPRYRNWNLDYFTSALLTPNAGANGEILIPEFNTDLEFPWTQFPVYRSAATGNIVGGGDGNIMAQSTTGSSIKQGGYNEVYLDNSNVGATIRQMRLAVRMQEYLERLNRVGDRYRDYITGFYGRDPMPGVVDFAEFIGRAQSQINISDVMSLARTTDGGSTTTPVGAYTGKAIGGLTGKTFTYSCQEHGWIMGIISVCPMSSYMRNVERFWIQRNDKFDYALDEFARIGDQAILNHEINYSHNHATVDPLATWGFTGRFNEYRYSQSMVSGEMQTNNNWKDWHLAREFTPSTMALSKDFITMEDVREADVFEIVDGTHSIFAHIWNQCVVVRNLPKYGVPSLDNHAV